MTDTSSAAVQGMFGRIASRYDLANTILSFGTHWMWKRQFVDCLPRGISRVLDVATGTGDLLPLILEKSAFVVGADFSPEMLAVAEKRWGEKYPQRLSLLQADALALPFEAGSFDAITISFGVRNFESLEKGLRECLRVLKPGGSFLILEFGQPQPGLWRKTYQFYASHILPPIGQLITGDRTAYEYLPASAARFPCAEEFAAILKTCGGQQVSYASVMGGIAYRYACKK